MKMNDLSGTVVPLSAEDIIFIDAAFDKHHDITSAVYDLLKVQRDEANAAWDRVKAKWPEYSGYDLHLNKAKKRMVILALRNDAKENEDDNDKIAKD